MKKDPEPLNSEHRAFGKSARWKEEPNQSLEPTSVLSTSAAEQPLVPSTLVAL
jgi:hypothetical protein